LVEERLVEFVVNSIDICCDFAHCLHLFGKEIFEESGCFFFKLGIIDMVTHSIDNESAVGNSIFYHCTIPAQTFVLEGVVENFEGSLLLADY